MFKGLGKMLGVSKGDGEAASPYGDFPPPNEAQPTVIQPLTPFPLTGPQVVHKGYLYTLPSSDDLAFFRQLCDSMEGWTLRYDRDGVYSWDRSVPGAAMRLIKVFGVFEDIAPELIYDVLQDPDFRETWDVNRLDAAKLGRLSETSDVGYYAAKVQKPVANRDFVNMRCWRRCGGGSFIIMSTSVPHKDMPPKNGLVRALTQISGFVLRPWGNGGCALTYMTQVNPKGWLPGAFVNTLTAKVAPNVVINLRKAVPQYAEFNAKRGYEKKSEWASEENPLPENPSPLMEWIVARRNCAAPPPPVTPPADEDDGSFPLEGEDATH